MTEPLRTVVTGARHGIGFAVAEALRARGDIVVGLDIEPGDDIISCDLASVEDRASAYAAASTQLGGVDVLVNCAGIYAGGSILDFTAEQWRAVLAVDLEAAVDLMQLAATEMVTRRFGRIVNITSVHAVASGYGCLAYDVAKAGLEAATRSAALDLARLGVLVNAVAPGFVRTRMSLLPDGTDETDSDDFRSVWVDSARLPLGRSAHANEIGSAVAFLSGRENTYSTGVVLTVDGGMLSTF